LVSAGVVSDEVVRPAPRHAGWAALAAGLAALVVYVLTLAPSIYWGDSPELTAAAYVGGVPHPTGYPLYMLLARAFLRGIPFSTPAYQMNLLSALSAAAAVGFTALIVFHVTRSRAAALIGALLFAFGTTFWGQAVIAEVYAFHLTLVTALLAAVLAWDRRGDRRWLRAAAVLYGLGFTHHLMSVLLLPGLLFFALTSRHRRQFMRELWVCLPLCLVPLLLYAYLPVRAQADPPLNWGDPRTWPNFLDHVSGSQYRGFMFHRPFETMGAQLARYAGAPSPANPGFLIAQYGGAMLLLALLGLLSLARTNRRLAAFTGLIYGAVTLWAMNYTIPDVDAYYIPSHLIVAVWMGCGVRQLVVWVRRGWKRLQVAPEKRPTMTAIVTAALLLLPFSVASANWELNDRSAEWSAITYARAALDALRPNALVVGGVDDPYFPVLYTRFVENRRPDVILTNVFDLVLPQRMRLTSRLAAQGLTVRLPECILKPGREIHEDNCVLRQLLKDNLGARPVYVLGLSEKIEAMPWMKSVTDGYYLVKQSSLPLSEVTARQPILDSGDQRPEVATSVVFGGKGPRGLVPKLEFTGFDLRPLERGDLPWYRVRAYWRTLDPALARKAEVRMVLADAEGNYQLDADGSSNFYSSHPLGYGFGAGKQAVPERLREVTDIYVPPGGSGRPLYVWLAVVVDGQFLPVRGQESFYVRLAPLPGRAVTPNPS